MADTKLVLLGVTGGIAAYKSAELVRLLQKADLDVKVVMTAHATQLIGPATFRALTGHEVALDLFEDPGKPIHHISLSQEPSCFVIAPATANAIAKIARGVADDLLTTTAVAYKGPMVIAPAMNEAMIDDESTQENLRILQARGVRIVEAGLGYLACGDEGRGRLADIELIRDAVVDELSRSRDLSGKHVVITAGPTQEPIDAVRHITNRSSGKMGYALAQEARMRGAEVTLISGPVSLSHPAEVTVLPVRTAREMFEALKDVAPHADMVLSTAAVSDHRPVQTYGGKLKKSSNTHTLTSVDMVENPDLLAWLGKTRRAGGLERNPVIVGFAAETEDLVENARRKLHEKDADYIVANDVSRPDIGFDSDENAVTILSADGETVLDIAPKRVIARQILDSVLH